jgi:transketolase C-terminal domain/subunit
MWLAEATGDGEIVCLDNHMIPGGQGEEVLRALAASVPEATRRVRLLGVEGVPRCGSDGEVLGAHGLDAEKLAATARQLVLVAGRQ